MRFAKAVLGAGLLALFLAACAPAPAHDPVPSTTAATATPGPAPADTPSTERLAFSGDCAQVLEPAELVTAMGEGTQLRAVDDEDPVSVLTARAERDAGAMTCVWAGAGDRMLTVTIAPLSIVPKPTVEAAKQLSCGEEDGTQVCHVGLAAGDGWLEVAAPDEAAANAVLGPVGSRLVSQHPRPVEFPVDAWSMPTCPEVGSAVSRGLEWTQIDATTFSQRERSSVADGILDAHGSMMSCEVSSPAKPGSVLVAVFTGFDDSPLAELGLADTTVRAADEAGARKLADGSTVVFATVGSNVVAVRGDSAAGLSSSELAAVSSEIISDAKLRPVR